MKLHDMSPAQGATRARKRLGRGTGSGLGKTSGKGHKGQKARSGGSIRPGFEGGQMPLYLRLPKRGFTNRSHKEYAIVNVAQLNVFEEGALITPDTLKQAGVIHNFKDGVKILGEGEISKALKVQANLFSASAKEKIEAAKGSVEVI